MHREELELAEKALGEREKEAKVSTQSVSVYVGMFLGYLGSRKLLCFAKKCFALFIAKTFIVLSTIATKKSNSVEF